MISRLIVRIAQASGRALSRSGSRRGGCAPEDRPGREPFAVCLTLAVFSPLFRALFCENRPDSEGQVRLHAVRGHPREQLRMPGRLFELPVVHGAIQGVEDGDFGIWYAVRHTAANSASETGSKVIGAPVTAVSEAARHVIDTASGPVSSYTHPECPPWCKAPALARARSSREI